MLRFQTSFWVLALGIRPHAPETALYTVIETMAQYKNAKACG